MDAVLRQTTALHSAKMEARSYTQANRQVRGHSYFIRGCNDTADDRSDSQSWHWGCYPELPTEIESEHSGRAAVHAQRCTAVELLFDQTSISTPGRLKQL